jgi:hypothetical protein
VKPCLEAILPRARLLQMSLKTVNYVEIDSEDWRFQPRVAAVCVWRDHVLPRAT